MSALAQLPAVTAAFGQHEKIAIFTANSETLKPMRDLIKEECGVDPDESRYVIVGCQDVPGFEAVALGEKVDVAGKWCYEMGAESLEDLGETQGFGDSMDFVMEFAMALEPLPPIKKAKLVRRIRQALAKHKTEL